MEPAKNPFRPNLILILLIAGLIAFILYILFYVNPAQIADILSKTNLAIYSVAFVTYILYTFCSSLVWHSLLNNLSVNITRRKAFLFTWVGLFFEATVPQLGWSGEISRTYMLSKDSDIESGKIGASVVGQKIFTMTMTVAALTAGLVLVLFKYSLPIEATFLITLVLVLSILALAVIYYISIKPSATKTLLQLSIRIMLVFRKKWDPEGFRLKGEEMLGSFHVGFEQLKAKPKGLLAPIIYAVLSFVFEVSVMSLVFLALGEPVPFDVVLIVFTLTGTLQTVGVSVFGFPELIMTLTFTALYIDPAVAVSVALLTRVVNLWFRLAVSYGALQLAGVRIMKQSKVIQYNSI
jgi:uncharacterized protein (TIRG00374 family)